MDATDEQHGHPPLEGRPPSMAASRRRPSRFAIVAGETPALQRRPADAKPIGICCSYGFGGGRVLPVGAPIPL